MQCCTMYKNHSEISNLRRSLFEERETVYAWNSSRLFLVPYPENHENVMKIHSPPRNVEKQTWIQKI